MIISTCGYGYTGASAVLDFLQGYNSIQYLDYVEFQLLHQVDGILDLKYHLTQNKERISCNSAINRFLRQQKKGTFAAKIRKLIGKKYDSLTQEYIKSLTIAQWDGRSNYDPSDVSAYSSSKIIFRFERAINKILKKLNIMYPKKKRYFSILSVDLFDEITKKYLNGILQALSIEDDKDILLDMLFSATNPDAGTEFFDESKIILVDRDPRDIFIVSHRKDEEYSFMPFDTVENFIAYYRALRKETTLSNKVLVVRYEDLIYKYWETTDRIIKFLGYKNRPENEFKFFNPDISMKYTNLKSETFEGEIKKIESELHEFLYDFTPYTNVENQKKAGEEE